MSEGDALKDINRIRTFANDVVFAKREQQVAQKDASSAPKKEKSIILKKTPPIIPQDAPITQQSVTTASHQSAASEEIPVTNKVSAESFTKKYATFGNDVNEIAKPEKQSILTDKHDSFEGVSLGSGTIIRDIKHRRFKLFPSMGQAIINWFEESKAAYTEARHPVHIVENVEARVSTIQKAAEKTKQAPREDFKVVAQRLKTIERKPISPTLSFKPKAEVPEPSWTYIEDQPVQDTTVEQDYAQTPVPRVSKEVPIQDEPIAQQQVQEVKPIAVEEEPVQIIRPVIVKTEPIQEEIRKNEVPHVVPEIPKFETLQGESERQQSSSRSSQESNKLSTFILIGVIVCATLLGVGISFYLFSHKAPKNTAQIKTPIVYEAPTLINTQKKIGFALPNDHASLLSAIETEISQNPGTVQVYPTEVTTTGDIKPASVEAILDVLSLQISGSFSRSIKEIEFGGVDSGIPFILIKATNFDVAFAGMLDWEKTLSSDLTPLFGQPVNESFDPEARTATQMRDAFFKDIIANNKNARLLVDENGTDRVVYTFINQNTILITTTRDALGTLIPLLQQ